ncbi:transglycosylase SLT domain-containing protein [Planosporangium sp. 12N6]|uniref:transglycosylase SLT domain-containing protein n=1 Tax=Planosporangium spinosum TaxID=3402278 RepID=UPI003CEAED69
MTVVDVMDRVHELRTQLGLNRPAVAVGDSAFASALGSAQSAWSALDGTASAGYGSAATGDAVVASARKYLGVPYVFGGNDPATGLDCSSLVQRAYADLGVKLPRIAADQAREGQPVASLAQARPGDLLAFNSPVDHIAIYIGDGKMIAAPQTGDVVKVQNVYKTPSAIRRILPDTAPSVLPALRPPALSGTAGIAGLTGSAGIAGLTGSAGIAGLTGSAGVPYADAFAAATAKYGLPQNLLAAVAKVESGYDPRAVSPAGAQGLMQLMPSTARGLGVNPFDPAQAIDGAARLLAGNLREFGSVPLALAAYNAGGGAVRTYGGIPPYAETQSYVPKVQAALAALQGRGTS